MKNNTTISNISFSSGNFKSMVNADKITSHFYPYSILGKDSKPMKMIGEQFEVLAKNMDGDMILTGISEDSTMAKFNVRLGDKKSPEFQIPASSALKIDKIFDLYKKGLELLK